MSNHDPDVPSGPPPPSYEEAVNTAPHLPERPEPPLPTRPQSQNTHSAESARPSGRPTSQAPEPRYGSNHQSRPDRPSSHGTSSPPASASIYSNNSSLPFEFPKGYLCQKCKNTGYKIKNGKPCSVCWPKFASRLAYQPNPQLPFKYPKGYICAKCRNTGTKTKNGHECSDCFSRFFPRNPTVSVPPATSYGHVSNGLLNPMNLVPSFLNPSYMLGPPGAMQVPPGDPRMGGVLCWKCHGSGRTYSFLFEELCSQCGGLGRLVNVPPAGHYY